MTVIALVVLGVIVGLSLARVRFPVGAAAFVELKQYRGRIYNDDNRGESDVAITGTER